MFQIKPIPVGYPAQEANNIEITIGACLTHATTCTTYYVLLNSTINVDGQGVEIKDNKILAEGSVFIIEEQFAEWGVDNAYIENIVLNNLGLERV